jgi:endonuclease YncB( thermonuclease family)
MAIETYDLGSCIIIEVEFKRYAAYVGYAYFDPTTAKITVTDPAGTKKVDAQDLVQYDSVVGKYYYKVQSVGSGDTIWLVGAYKVQVDAVDTPDTDITVCPRLFYLS